MFLLVWVYFIYLLELAINFGTIVNCLANHQLVVERFYAVQYVACDLHNPKSLDLNEGIFPTKTQSLDSRRYDRVSRELTVISAVMLNHQKTVPEKENTLPLSSWNSEIYDLLIVFLVELLLKSILGSLHSDKSLRFHKQLSYPHLVREVLIDSFRAILFPVRFALFDE